MQYIPKVIQLKILEYLETTIVMLDMVLVYYMTIIPEY